MGVSRNVEQEKLPEVDGVQPFAKKDDEGRIVTIGAIDEDDGKIRALADRLQRIGYGVMRQKNPRAGRIYHRLRATWAGPGDPPEHPLEGESSGDAAHEGDGRRRKS